MKKTTIGKIPMVVFLQNNFMMNFFKIKKYCII
jgi:hypothetical protein